MKIENIEIKEKFGERYEKLTDYDEFIKYSKTYLRKSIRINTLKISIDECRKKLSKDWILTQIPWLEEGFWIKHKKGRLDIGNTLEHQLGYIYVQEAASMIPPIVLEPKPGDKVLDMCAAPGSKSSQIGAMMNNKGLLIANDIGLRINALSFNLQRCGVSNAIVTAMEGRFFKDKFDKILLDAPCSGTGTIRKSLKTLMSWNPDMVRRLAGTQRQLISTAFENLRKNGILVYSTCTLEPEEDEGIVDFLLNKYKNAKLEEIDVKGLKRSNTILEFNGEKYNPEINKCLRIWPQDNDTEGFFVAKIRKV